MASLVDKKKTPVSGPFTVEGVPAPAVKSVEALLPSPPAPLPGGDGRMADASTIPRSIESLRVIVTVLFDRRRTIP